MADFSDIQGLLAQFQPSDADKLAAQKMGLIAAGLGLMNARRGQEFSALGQGGLLGLNAYQGALQQSGDARAKAMQQAAQAMSLQEIMRKNADEDATRKVVSGIQPMQNPMQAAMGAAPSLAPTTGNVAAVTQAAASMPKPGLFQQLNQIADALQAKGLVPQAMQYRELAQKYAPKYKGLETVMQGDKPVLLQTFDNQEPTPLSGYQPKPDYKQVDTGGQVGFYDPVLGKSGATFDKTLTPNDAAMLPIHQGELAVAQGNLGVNRGRLAVEQSNAARAAANEGKPQIVTDNNGNFFAVDPRSAIGKQITAEGGTPLNKGEKPLTESQAKATVFANQMIAASRQLDDLTQQGFTGKNLTQQAEAKLAGSPGNVLAPSIAQKYSQAAKQWTEGFLRFQSGATITPSELDQAMKTYFPQPGDGPAVVAQKEAARRQAEANMGAAAGAGATHFLSRAPAKQNIDTLLDKYAPR